MPAHHTAIGQPAHEAERQGLRFLVEGLDENFAVFSNCWIVDRSGQVYELDAVVVAEHAIYVVELKAFRGRVTGNDHDWYVPGPIRSPLKLNRKTAQILASELKRRSFDAGRAWVDHLIFLTHTDDVDLDGPVSSTQVHSRKTILGAIRGTVPTSRRTQAAPVDKHTYGVLRELLTGADVQAKPPRRFRDYEVEGVIERTERYTEYRARHTLMGSRAGLRVYRIDPLTPEAAKEKLLERCRWEAQVLGRIGSHPHVLGADPPFTDEEQIHLAMPFELFQGITLESWIKSYRWQLKGQEGLRSLVALWTKIASAIEHAHDQGVVHRLLRPEVILVSNAPTDPDVRVTGFELAKQLASGQTIHYSSLGDERLQWAAPEVLTSWSDASSATDQFGLGVLLAWLLTGEAPFESTHTYQRNRGVCPRLRDRNPFVSENLDQTVQTMLKLRPAERFPELRHAVRAVQATIGAAPRDSRPPPARLDPENLEEGARIGTDYEIRSKLGEGGLGTVYLARHLVSGTYRALKVARPNAEAEDALRAEHQVLKKLHERGEASGIVRPIDLSRTVPQRLTLVMERVEGAPLSSWLAHNPDPDPTQLRLYAEDLLAALIHLEQVDVDGKPVIHKDLKPGNLIVGDKGLTVIDFSLAFTDEPFAGTALYKDPNQTRWSHASDRYSAALCLHQLYTGRHPFGAEAPPPGEAPDIDPDDFDAPGLVAFFRKAMDPVADRRHPSAVAMRAAFLDALGLPAETGEREADAAPSSDAASLPLSATGLHSTAVACLRRAGVTTQGELVALSEAQVRGISGLGKKKAREVLELRRALIDAGVPPDPSSSFRHVLWPELVGDRTALVRAGFPRPLSGTLERAGYNSVGAVADATREELFDVDGVGSGTLRQIVDALGQFAERSRGGPDGAQPKTVADLWARATVSLSEQQREVLHGLYGFEGPVLTGEQLGEHLGIDQPKVSVLHTEALEHLDHRQLEESLRRLETQLDGGGGIIAMSEAVDGLLDLLPASRALGSEVDDETWQLAPGIVRVLVRCHQGQMRLRRGLDDGNLEVIHRPTLDGDDIARFAQAAREIAAWPPTEPESARRLLGRELPGFDQHRHSPLALAERVLGDVRLTDAGELFEAPVHGPDAIRYVIERRRLPIEVEELRRAVERAFGDFALFPEREHLPGVLRDLDLGVRVEEDRIVPASSGRASTPPPQWDPPPFKDAERTPEQAALEHLRGAAERGGYRLVVTPPERHPELGRTVARALGAEYISFEGALFERMGDRFPELEEASRFAAQRRILTREVERTLDALVRDKGRPAAKIVLGDTALLGTCAATHLVRQLYDATSGGTRGLWALVIPGVIRERQPWLNESQPVFHLEGQVVPLRHELPEVA